MTDSGNAASDLDLGHRPESISDLSLRRQDMLTTVADDDGLWDAWHGVANTEEPDPLEVLTVATMYEKYFTEIQNRAVTAARAGGRSWQEISQATGTSKQSAWQKWRTQTDKSKALGGRWATYNLPKPWRPHTEGA
jgi:hypothetical protein